MELELVDVAVDGRVASVTIDAPPVNVITLPLLAELGASLSALAGDDEVSVVVLRSADPDFFLAHFDVEVILSVPVEEEAVRRPELGSFSRLCELVRTMPKVTICEVAGRVGGGGAELAASCDLRFGALETFVLNQMEVPLGIIPGGTGTQRLPRLVGVGRALEIVLGGIDVDAVTAERWGWLNRALPAADLRGHVERLAGRIASFPPTGLALAKRSVRNAEDLPLDEALLEEAHLFARALRDPSARARMRAFLDAGGQTREVERRVAHVVVGLQGDGIDQADLEEGLAGGGTGVTPAPPGSEPRVLGA
ncbi:MAG: Enoyl-CoA hydratase [uncultured Acidimicrobiales bacterium]|uniref:Enoyl-CoA hydratase n=1 Tax=uncultured Acidimicrobiales bacterium TaxID=310071 RepID=A0A6J4HFX3_9ACTN|nr:MAG: Enoyl-CoA hydratase [uncultured Acidimicrobiales bacterium]